MDDQELRKLLEQLQSQIEWTKSLDEKGRELLHRLDKDIHDLLESPMSDSLQVRPPMLKQLQDSVDHFEATHPMLTSMLSQMLNILNNAGI